MSAAQTEAMDHFDTVVDDFCLFWSSSKLKERDWRETLDKRLDSYAGMVTTKAHDLTLARVIPLLPPEGLAGKVDAAALAEGVLPTDPQRPRQIGAPKV